MAPGFPGCIVAAGAEDPGFGGTHPENGAYQSQPTPSLLHGQPLNRLFHFYFWELWISIYITDESHPCAENSSGGVRNFARFTDDFIRCHGVKVAHGSCFNLYFFSMQGIYIYIYIGLRMISSGRSKMVANPIHENPPPTPTC